MKATIDIPDELYRKVKAKSALEGRPVRDVTVQLFRKWIDDRGAESRGERGRGGYESKPPWFGALREYAKNARGRHGMAAIRKSIGRGRAKGPSAETDEGG